MLHRILLPALLVLSLPTSLAAQERLSGDAAYAVYFGDGMRHYVEGRHGVAIEYLSRAFAMRPQAQTQRMIVRSYDAIGHCSAAQQQRTLFREMFPTSGEPPALERCATPATLTLSCGSADADLLIDEHILTTCAASVSLPPGEHIIEGRGFPLLERVTLTAKETRSLALPIDAAKDAKGKAAPREERVPRLASPSESFRVYLSPDGLYQIWARVDNTGPELLAPTSAGTRFVCRKGSNGQKLCEQR
jgi:hypothetical protein